MENKTENKIKIDQGQLLTGKQLTAIIKDYDNKQYAINETYYKGKNVEILTKGATKAKDNIKPNNIIPLPFARRTINDLMGYAYRPGNVSYMFDENQNEKSIETIKEIFENNDEPLESSEIFQDASIKGEGAELLYFADEQIQFAKVPREQCIFKYKDTIKDNELEHAIRFYKIIEVQTDGKDLIVHKAEVYTKTRIDYYQWEEKKDLRELSQKRDDEKFDTNFDKDYVYIESQLHPFGAVPLYPYKINSDKLGVFEPSIPLIDKLDGFGSDSIANSIDQFNDTILLLSKKLTPDMVKKIADTKVLDGLGSKAEGNFAEFLQKALDIDSTLESTKLFERWYYELTGIPNLHGEKFGLKSGIAIAYALVPFENLVTNMEIYFSKSLKYRLKLINNALVYFDKSFEPVEASLKWKRNLPFDLKERVDIVVALKQANLLSDETLLKMFPENMVKDAEQEIIKRRQEDIEEVKAISQQQQAMFQEPKIPIGEED